MMRSNSGSCHPVAAALRRASTLAAFALLAVGAAPPDGGPSFVHWIDGTTPEGETQVQRIDADTFVIRQSVRTNFEAPFLYLLFGSYHALLINSGAGGPSKTLRRRKLVSNQSAAST